MQCITHIRVFHSHARRKFSYVPIARWTLQGRRSVYCSIGTRTNNITAPCRYSVTCISRNPITVSFPVHVTPLQHPRDDEHARVYVPMYTCTAAAAGTSDRRSRLTDCIYEKLFPRRFSRVQPVLNARNTRQCGVHERKSAVVRRLNRGRRRVRFENRRTKIKIPQKGFFFELYPFVFQFRLSRRYDNNFVSRESRRFLFFRCYHFSGRGDWILVFDQKLRPTTLL